MSADARSPLNLHGMTLAATAASIAALASAMAVHSSEIVPVITVWSGIAAAMLAGAAWFRRLAATWSHVPAVSPIFLVLAVIPYLWDAGMRVCSGAGSPLEVVLLISVQLVACGMAAASCWKGFQPLTLVSGLFVTMFAASISQDRSTQIAAGCFALCGLAWLVSAYWSALVMRMPKTHVRRQPRSSLLIPLTGLLTVVLAVGATRSDRVWALAGFMPSSGGDGRQDTAANRGVGNGEALVAGEEDIQSFGPIEDAPFRASEDPSLYDLFNDLYDEPVVVRKQERAIALPPDLKQQLESRMAKSQRATREFSTARKQRSRSAQDMTHLTSDALFYVKGRTPLHLRHELFDLFDGITWHAVDPEQVSASTTLTMEDVQGRPWLLWPLPARSFECFGPVESHALKIVHLKSNRIPTPLQLRGIHIDQLNRADFFQAVGDQLVRMDVESLPELTAIHVRSQTVDRRRCPDKSSWTVAPEPFLSMLPDGAEMDRIRRLANEWAADLPRGWSQVNAILNRLRTEYTLDPLARPHPDAACPATDFLFATRRGPDYQFATAAALLLRSLGYSTRLVGGFYVSPERYDRLRLHTPVVGADAHIWLEVQYAGRLWLTLEPTPGYEVLEPPPTWWQQAIAVLWSVARWIGERWLEATALTAVAVAVWWKRVWWLDRLAMTLWHWRPSDSPRGRIAQTARLIDFRLWLVGCPRRPGQTWATTVDELAAKSSGLRRHGPHFADLAAWAAYAPAQEPLPVSDSIPWNDVCQSVVRAIDPVIHPLRRSWLSFSVWHRSREITSC